MKKVMWLVGITLIGLLVLAGCKTEDDTPPPPEVFEWVDVVPGDYWRPFYVRAYAEGGLPRSVEEEPTFADFLDAYCQYWGPLEEGEGDVVAYLDDGDAILYPWEAVYDFQYAFDGTNLWIDDWGIPFTVKNVSATGWTMRLDADDIGFADFLDGLGLEGMAWVEIDFELCGFEEGERVNECLNVPADWSTTDPDQWDYFDGQLATENNVGWISATGNHSPAPVGGSVGVMLEYQYLLESYDASTNGTPELNKHVITYGDIEFEIKPHTDRVRINPGGAGYAINIKQGGTLLSQAVISPFVMSAPRKWLNVDIILTSMGVGMQVEVSPGKYVSVNANVDATGTYSSFLLTHRTGVNENVDDYQARFRNFCVLSIPVQCGCD